MARVPTDEAGRDEAARVVWAKSWPFVGEVEQWLPLDQHLADAADVAGLLWDDWLADTVRDLVAAEVGGRDAARRLLRFLAGVHDVGKASPAFAVQVARLSDRMVSTGLRHGATVLVDRAALRHEIASAAALETWFAEHTTVEEELRRSLSVVVAGHHGRFPSRATVTSARSDLLGEGLWEEVRTLLIDRAAERASVDWGDMAGRRLSVACQAALSSVLILADWVSSDASCFPLIGVDVVPGLPPTRGVESRRAREGWARARFPRRWSAPQSPTDPSGMFRSRFPHLGEPRQVQREVVETAATALPGLLLVEAPMGSGKTEAALLAAEVLAARSGASGIFVALPTQATSSAMFSRFRDYLKRVPGDGVHTLALVHGKAALHEDAASLPAISAAMVMDDEPAARARRGGHVVPVAEVWARGRKRAALAQFVVGTIDQVLFAALLARHVVVRQLSLIGKVVVIDEVHAADTYMAVYLERALEWLGASRVPVVLLSATLPGERRRRLYEAYERGRRGDLAHVSDTAAALLAGEPGYPVVVASGEDRPAVRTPQRTGGSGAEVRLARLEDDLDLLVETLERLLKDGGCVAVVRNTVARAQETAAALEDVLGTDVVRLAHSRFVDLDRRAHDRALLDELGPRGSRPHRRVVVGTQVLEQSLDIDLDLLVTDLAPVDLVLQRIGRLHRHSGRDRPPPLRAPLCLVTGVVWDTVPRPVRGSVHVYGAYPLLAAAHVLAEHLDGRPLSLPDDIAPLVSRAYSPELRPPAAWEKEWETAHARDRKENAARRRRASTFLLDPPTGADLYGTFRGDVGDVDEDSPEGQACVRDSGDSVEVVAVVHEPGGDRLLPSVLGGAPLPLRHVPPEPDVAQALAGSTVRLPPAMVRDPVTAARVIAALERDRFDGWDASPLLRRQLALVLDEDLTADVEGFAVRYDARYGLSAAAAP